MKWIILFLLLILIVPIVSADTTFFDNEDDFFIMESPEVPVEEIGQGGILGITKPKEFPNASSEIICNKIKSYLELSSINLVNLTNEDINNIYLDLSINFSIDNGTLKEYIENYEEKCIEKVERIPEGISGWWIFTFFIFLIIVFVIVMSRKDE